MSDEPKPDGVKRRLKVVTVERPRCPYCQGFEFRKTRSIRDQGDGTALWWAKCKAASCMQSFKVVLE